MNDGSPASVPGDAGSDPDVATRLVRVLSEMSAELHPGRVSPERITLDASLERDLGLDSLGRAELLSRVEREFGVILADRVMVAAETGRDLVRAIRSGRAAPAAAGPAAPTPTRDEEAGAPPDHASTLVEVLAWHAERSPDRTHIHLYTEEEEIEEISYGALWTGAEAAARGLLDLGVQPGQAVALMLPTGRDYFCGFFGVLLAGAVPVPIYPPVRPSQLESHVRRHARILDNALTAVLVTVPEAKIVSGVLKAAVPTLTQVVTVPEVSARGSESARYTASSSDIALLQYTSGSTGDPKGVVLTHGDLLANLRIMGRAIEIDSTDVFVSWLPLYHDMGLIGAWFGSLYYAARFVVMSPVRFLRRPERWLEALHRHRGTLSASPNFGYELCVHKVPDETLADLDLGAWRLAFNGAEPISPDAMDAFAARFAGSGFRRQAMAPVYGLAECTLGLTFPPLGRGPLVDRIDGDAFARDGRAVPAADGGPGRLRFVACGQPLPGYQIRIVDPAGREQPERVEGGVQFRGPSATSGYFRNAEASARLFDGEWLDTGDLGYMADADLYITRRAKDVIIRGGRNLFPYELEEAAGDVPGVRKGCVAVFGTRDARSGTERVVLVAEVRDPDPETQARIRSAVLDLAADTLGGPVDEVVLAPPHTVLKTSSGKIRRSACRELYESGSIGDRSRPVWLQLARLQVAGVPGRLRNLGRTLSGHGYAAYAWAAGGTVALLAFPVVVLAPSLSWRRRAARAAARAVVAVSGSRIEVEGAAHLDGDSPRVLVANHASYADGIVLAAALPPGFGFVAKQELAGSPGVGLLLRRLGTEFVERADKQRGVADARRVATTAKEGQSVLFFPEGTLRRMAGVMPFHMGAFVAAAETGNPVVPIALSGTRSILRAGSWYPRRGVVRVRIGEPIEPRGSDWAVAVRLRDAARDAILERCGEPSLDYVPDDV